MSPSLRRLLAYGTILTAGTVSGTFAARAEEIHCVADMAGLRTALGAWTASVEPLVTIRLVRGVYAVDSAAGNVLGMFQSTTAASLQLLGGYADGCDTRVVDPRNTVIDGGNEMNSYLRLYNVAGDVLVEGVTLTRLPNGVDVVHTSAQPAAGHRLRIEHSRIVGNDSRFGNGGPAYTLRLWGVGEGTSGAEVALVNSVLARNYNSGFTQSSTLTTGNSGRIVLTGSTIASNTLDIGAAGIVLQNFASASGIDFVVMNNIAWHNGTLGAWLDIDVSHAQQPPAVTWTLAGAIRGDIQPTATNLSVDPHFLSPGGGNFRLGGGSPAVDAGSATQPDGFPDHDLDGRPRIAGPAVDLGAYEAVPGDLIFYDGMDD